jgi:hypothetical protein
MSRGPGKLQRYLFQTLSVKPDTPLSFAEILQIAYPSEPYEYRSGSSEIRSLRRALHTMVRDKIVLALGAGGPADPHRYCINPMLRAMVR